jgi:hypothetical protein
MRAQGVPRGMPQGGVMVFFMRGWNVMFATLLVLSGCTAAADRSADLAGEMTKEEEDAYVAETLAADARPEDPR